MEDFAIQFQGFSPSSFAKDYARAVMSKVHEEAPSSSSVRVTISKTSDGIFKGIVRIRSSAGAFFAVATGARFPDVVHELLERVRRQFSKWKSRRFNHESVRRPLHLVPKHAWKKGKGGRHENDSRVG